MEPTDIIIIVGIILLFVERMFTCLYRVRKSKCCGGELEMSNSPAKEPNSLNVSTNIRTDTQEKIEEIVKRLSGVQK